MATRQDLQNYDMQLKDNICVSIACMSSMCVWL